MPCWHHVGDGSGHDISTVINRQIRPMLLFTKKQVMGKMLMSTTQYGTSLLATHSIKNNLKLQFPANKSDECYLCFTVNQ